MTLEQIKAAIDEGKKVYWSHEGYEVRKSQYDDSYYIICLRSKSSVGLTWRDGITMNGKPEEFFVKGE